MNNEKKKEKDTIEEKNSMERGANVESVIKQLMSIDSMFQDFIDAETEGMILCENCYDTAFDDDEDICVYEDGDGIEHNFCCEDCMNEWKKRELK